MNQTTELRSKAVAAGSALLITAIWMTGIAALLQHGTARAEPAVQRMETIEVRATRLPRFERMQPVVVTGHRTTQQHIASAGSAVAQG